MSRTAAGPGTGRWRNMRTRDGVRVRDARWFYVQPPKKQRRQCRGCRFKDYPVRMRVWFEAGCFSWRCPCCSFTVPIDVDRFLAWIETNVPA